MQHLARHYPFTLWSGLVSRTWRKHLGDTVADLESSVQSRPLINPLIFNHERSSGVSWEIILLIGPKNDFYYLATRNYLPSLSACACDVVSNGMSMSIRSAITTTSIHDHRINDERKLWQQWINIWKGKEEPPNWAILTQVKAPVWVWWTGGNTVKALLLSYPTVPWSQASLNIMSKWNTHPFKIKTQATPVWRHWETGGGGVKKCATSQKRLKTTALIYEESSANRQELPCCATSVSVSITSAWPARAYSHPILFI